MSYPVDSQLSETLAVDYDALIIPSGEMHLETLAEELHAARIIKAFLRENMPVLVQGDALNLISEIDTAIQTELIRDKGETGRHNRLLWVDDETSITIITRNFVAVCLEEQNEDIAAA